VKAAPEVLNDVLYPAGVLKLLPAHHTKSLEKSNAARAELDPKKTYKFTLEGKVSFGGQLQDIWIDDCQYVLEGPGVTQDNAYGVLNAKRPVIVTGATRLYAFAGDSGTKRHSGAFRITWQTRGEAPQRMLVDAIVHNVTPGPTERLQLANLRAFDHYKVTLRAGVSPPRFKPKGKRVPVIFGIEAGRISPIATATERRPHRVFEVGKTYDVSGTDVMWFWFPDDDPSDNSGEVEITVEVNHGVIDFGPGMWSDDPNAKTGNKPGKRR
jgi:hypothetical protein